MCESGLRTKRCKSKSLKGGFFCFFSRKKTEVIAVKSFVFSLL